MAMGSINLQVRKNLSSPREFVISRQSDADQYEGERGQQVCGRRAIHTRSEDCIWFAQGSSKSIHSTLRSEIFPTTARSPADLIMSIAFGGRPTHPGTGTDRACCSGAKIQDSAPVQNA
jgi:hypothetical protein